MRQPYRPLLLAMALGILLLPGQGWAADDGSELSKQENAAAPAALFGSGKQEIALAIGYAIPLPVGSDNGTRDVEYVFLAPRGGVSASPTRSEGRTPGTGVTLSWWGKGSFSKRWSPRAGLREESPYYCGIISFPAANSFRLWRPGQVY